MLPFGWSEFRDREKVMREIKKVDGVVIDGYQLYHNYKTSHGIRCKDTS